MPWFGKTQEDTRQYIKSVNLPRVEENADFKYGPDSKDFRSREDYSNFIKNKHDGEKFWHKYITPGGILCEVRWDLFEDGLLLCLHESILIKIDQVKDINWDIFL